MTRSQNIGHYFIWFILVASITYNALCFRESLSNIVPNPQGRSDEMDYFTDAKSFYLNNTIHTSLSVDESVSKIGACGSHGFAYAVFYGTMQKIFFGSDLALVLANLASLLFALFYLYRQPYSFFIKNSIAALVLTYFLTIVFLHTYFVEILNLSFALFLSLYLYKIYTSADKTEKRKKAWLFFIFVLVLSTFRSTYLFFLFGLLPMAENKKAFLLYCGMIVSGIICIAIFDSLFFSSAIFHPTKSVVYLLIHGGDNKITMAYDLILNNLKCYFIQNTSCPSYLYYYKYVLLILPLLQAYFYVVSKDKIYLLPLTISALYLGFICTLNNNEADLNDLRPLSAIFILNIVFLSIQGKTLIQYALILIAIVSLPEINEQVQYNAAVRDKYCQYYSRKAAQKNYDPIKDYRSEKDIITVQLPDRMWLFDDLYLMPLVSNEGKPIRYNITYFKPAPEKSSFITHYLR